MSDDTAPKTEIVRDETGRWRKGICPNPGGRPTGLAKEVRGIRMLAAEDMPAALDMIREFIAVGRKPESSRYEKDRAVKCAEILAGMVGVSPMKRAPDEGLDDADLARNVTPGERKTVQDLLSSIPREQLHAIARSGLMDQEESDRQLLHRSTEGSRRAEHSEPSREDTKEYLDK